MARVTLQLKIFSILRGFVAQAICLLCFLSTTIAADFSEYDVKAAMILNFLKFSSRVTSPTENAKICIATDREDVREAFSVINRKNTEHGLTEISHVQDDTNLRTCSVLFVAQDMSNRLEQDLQPLTAAGVLTIGETESFLTSGGVVNFFSEGTRIRFRINPKKAASAGVSFSSKVLSLAIIEDS